MPIPPLPYLQAERTITSTLNQVKTSLIFYFSIDFPGQAISGDTRSPTFRFKAIEPCYLIFQGIATIVRVEARI